MSYTKPSQAQYVDNLQPGEFVVKIDTTPVATVAVSIAASVDDNTGNLVIEAFTRVVKNDGSSYLDANGQPLSSTFQTSMDIAGVAAIGGAAQFKKLMALTVLGEDVTTGPLSWKNALPKDVIDHASIRTNIAAAISAASTDLSSIL